VFRAVNAVEEGLNNASPENLGFRPDDSLTSATARKDALQESKETEIGNGIVQLESLLNATVDKDFDKFEIYTLRNILALGHEEEQLAGWVQLDHYKNLDLSRTENSPTPEQVQLQRRKLNETSKLNSMLKAEEARNAAVLEQLRTLTGSAASNSDSEPQLAFLTAAQQTSKNSNGQVLSQNVQYALTQLPAIREHIAQLKQSLQSPLHTRRGGVNEDSTDYKRTNYIYHQSRRALDRKGIEPEQAASVAAGLGRRVGREEIQGIEAVVQALGGAEATMRSNDEMEE
jgi:kinetochore protein Mis12/MTW1